ncbi:MAG: type II toxin-antitoxin system RatA family toxin [Pontibacterium sp.]
MGQINRTALVMHTAEQMFELVNDVEGYSAFLPWCQSAEIISSSDDLLEARLHLHKGALSYSFATRNHLERPHKMTLSLMEGPFSDLQGCWEFIPLSEEACKVNFSMSYSFANKLASLAMGKVFNQVASTMVDAFVKRADEVYT